MPRCSPGDQVVCHIENGSVLSVYQDKMGSKHIFEIISIYEEGYLIYIPISIYLKDCIKLTAGNIKKFNANKKFIDSSAYYITDFKIISIYKKADGICCVKCDIFSQFAEPNQSNGSFICWSCREWPFYK